MQISLGVMAGPTDFTRITNMFKTKSYLKNFIGLNVVAGRRVGVSVVWSFGFHFKSSRLWLLLTPKHPTVELAGQVTDLLPRHFCGAGIPQSQLSSLQGSGNPERWGPVGWAVHKVALLIQTLTFKQRKCKRPPLLTLPCKAQALGRSFLHLETYWFLSLIVRPFDECLLPSQTESQPFSAGLNKQELSGVKSYCLSVGSNTYGIANLVPGHVGLMLHAGVVTQGEKA